MSSAVIGTYYLIEVYIIRYYMYMIHIYLPGAKPHKQNRCSGCRAEFPKLDGKRPSLLEITDHKVWMKTPARVQVPYNPEIAQYVEGSEDFNVWYGKYLSDRRGKEKDRYAASLSGHKRVTVELTS